MRSVRSVSERTELGYRKMAKKGSVLASLNSKRPKPFISVDILRQALQVLALAMIVCSALTIWKFLIVFTGSESPVVVVLSGSMEPSFRRGDLLFLYHRYEDRPLQVGDIVVFKIEGRDIPIVHRILRRHVKEDGEVYFLTKGDNNAVDDRGLYNPGQRWLPESSVIGRAHGYLPHVGMVTIIMNDYPMLKFALLGFLGILVLMSNEV